jgi:hypothetical protein
LKIERFAIHARLTALATALALAIVPGSQALGISRTHPRVSARPACGSGWRVVPSPNLGDFDVNILTGVTALSRTDAWAVGYHLFGPGAPIQTLTEHWDGLSWSVVASPSPASELNVLSGVAAVASDDVWAVGTRSNAPDGSSSKILIEHWNGSGWNLVPVRNLATQNGLAGVTAIAADDVWAVGSYYVAGRIQRSFALVEHWRGRRWRPESVPNTGTSDLLGAVSASSAEAVWTVGSIFNSPDTLVERRIGRVWSHVPSESAPLGVASLTGVGAIAPDDVWAVGIQGKPDRQHLMLQHWDGASFTAFPKPTPGTFQSGFGLPGIAARATNDAWVVGNYFDGTSTKTLVEHWNGAQWTLVPSPNPSEDSNSLSGVTASPSGEVWAVGNYRDLSIGSYRTLIERSCPA